jgi:hypothetical protein
MLTQCTSLRAVPSGHELRADEQRDALHALGRAARARQHQVDDVVRHVVLAVGDEDLGAEQLVVPSGCGSARVRTSDRSEPACGSVRFIVPVQLPSIMRRDVGLPLLVAAGRQQRLDGAVGEQRAQREADVGAVENISLQAAPISLGRPWPPKATGMLQALPATFGELAERLLEAGRGRDLAVLERRGVLVALPVQRRDHPSLNLAHSSSTAAAVS